MAIYLITRESKLSDCQISDMAAFISLAFSEDPIVRFHFGEYHENQALWQACCEDDIRKAETIGRIYTTRSESGGILAIAVGFDPGHDVGDLPDGKKAEGLLASQPEEQRVFRKEYLAKQAAVYQATYPSNVRRDDVYLHHFAVEKAHRGQGIGSTLIQRVVGDAKYEGYRTVLDTSTLINVAFYQRNGFQRNAEFEVSHYKYGSLPMSFALATDE